MHTHRGSGTISIYFILASITPLQYTIHISPPHPTHRRVWKYLHSHPPPTGGMCYSILAEILKERSWTRDPHTEILHKWLEAADAEILTKTSCRSGTAGSGCRDPDTDLASTISNKKTPQHCLGSFAGIIFGFKHLLIFAGHGSDDKQQISPADCIAIIFCYPAGRSHDDDLSMLTSGRKERSTSMTTCGWWMKLEAAIKHILLWEGGHCLHTSEMMSCDGVGILQKGKDYSISAQVSLP